MVMPDAPDPVPPAGKPKIGVVWVAVVAVLGLIFAAWIYSASKPARDQTGPGASSTQNSTP
jgi:hypothetical protein